MGLKKYAQKHIRLLKNQLRHYRQSPDESTLHKIRVEVKKIKALLGLVNDFQKRFHAHRHFIPFRNIFRKAGEIREPLVIAELLSKHHVKIDTDSYLPQKKREGPLSREFRKKVPAYIKSVESEEEKLRKYFKKIRRAQIVKYIKEKKEELKLQLKSKWVRGTLHGARKTAKEIIYLAGTSKKIGRNTDSFFEKIQDIIGQWHDKQLILSLLKENGHGKLQKLCKESREDEKDIKALAERYCGRAKA